MPKVKGSSRLNPVVEVGVVVEARSLKDNRDWIRGEVCGRDFLKGKLVAVEVAPVNSPAFSSVRWRLPINT